MSKLLVAIALVWCLVSLLGRYETRPPDEYDDYSLSWTDGHRRKLKALYGPSEATGRCDCRECRDS